MRPTYAAAVLDLETPEAVAAFLLARRQEMRVACLTPRASFRPPDGLPLSRQLTELTDAAVQQLFRLSLPQGSAVDRVRGLMAVAATGSYGRRELSPYSDVDVTFIVAEEEDETLDRTVRRMFLSLMEVFSQRAQLKVGYAYRTLADLPQLDHQTQTTLLDARLVAGSSAIFHPFIQELPRHIWPAAFVRQKVAERCEQAARHGETIYRVEPQLRDGPGGLRELQVAEWVAAIAFPAARGDVWRQLARAGWLSPRDADAALASRGFLLHVRNIAHFEAGRAADLLTRERQEQVATLMGFQDDDRASAVERFMESYYRHAENARRVAGFVTTRCLRERLSLDAEIAVEGGELVPAYPGLNVTEPHFLLRLCRAYQEHGLEPGPGLRRMIAEQLAETDAIPVDVETGRQFLALLDGSHLAVGAPSRLPPPGPGEPGVISRPTLAATLGLMGTLGILQRLIPELGEAYRRVPFDPIHRHTIGHHSLRVVQALERLREGVEISSRERGGYFSPTRENGGEFQRIWNDVENPEVLYLAGLLHDIGKLEPTPGHEETGAVKAQEIAARLGMDPAGTEKVVALVRHHLLMSRTSQLRDLTLEATIRDFVAAVPSLDLLKMLFLLTHADMEATGVLSPVKVRFLEDLFYRAEQALSEQSPIGMDDERLHRYRRRLSRQLSEHHLSEDRVQEHCQGMPVSYLLNTRAEQIAAHIRAVEALANSGPVVEWGGEPGSPITTLTVCTYDDPQPGLLSRIAGVLYAHEISVHSAQVFTRSAEHGARSRSEATQEGAGSVQTRDIAIDTLWVDFHARQVPPFKKMEVETDLLRVLRGLPVTELLASRHKELPPAICPTRVAFDNNLAEGHTVVDVEVPDQPGTLYRITRTLAALGWVIHSARISTQGDRARDAFYITDAAGAKIEGDESALLTAFTETFMRG